MKINKEYVSPVISVVAVDIKDIITTSPVVYEGGDHCMNDQFIR